MKFIYSLAITMSAIFTVTAFADFIDSHPIWALLTLIALAIIVLRTTKKKIKLHDFGSGCGRIK